MGEPCTGGAATPPESHHMLRNWREFLGCIYVGRPHGHAMLNVMASSATLGQASALAAASVWMRDALLGTVASGLAVLAVAMIGFGMLTGRIAARRAIRVVLGCFVVFGATAIAAGMVGLATGVNAGTASAPAAETPPPLPKFTPPPPRDPYAGASVPM